MKLAIAIILMIVPRVRSQSGDSCAVCAPQCCSAQWVPGRQCQCNTQCAAYGNCCSDYNAVCKGSGPPVPPPPSPPPSPPGRLPATCQEVVYGNPAAIDGEYELQCQGAPPIQVWCHDMTGDDPKEFLTLHLSSPDHNFATYFCGQDCAENAPDGQTASTVTTAYSRIRINPCTLKVDVTERTFAKSTGKLWHPDSGGAPTLIYDFEPFGVTESCESGGQEGKSNIDLSQTPFVVKQTFALRGASPTGTTTVSTSKQVVDLTGGGFCGSNGPTDWRYFDSRDKPQWVMQLELRPQAKAAAPHQKNKGTVAIVDVV